jgi:serine/threonine-protein kinase
MGRVYEGRHVETKARTGIKVLHPDVAKDSVAVERFRREFETAQMLDHPHVVQVLDHGETGDGSWFMTMEYLHGEELSDVIRRIGALPPERTLRIASQIALALDHAHSFGVIHRDLKPDNIFLTEGEDGDVVKILDFGSVKLQMEMGPKLTAFGTTLGSPYYMSPEQAMGKQDVDQRTDVFALAAIVYEMVTGKVAFEGAAVAEILMKIVNENPPAASGVNATYPPALDDVIDKGLRKDKTRRYESTLALADAVASGFGLTPNVELWAAQGVGQTQREIDSASPPDPKPFGSSSVAPPAEPQRGAVGAVPSSSRPPARRSGIAGGFGLWLTVLGVITIGGAIAVAYALLT